MRPTAHPAPSAAIRQHGPDMGANLVSQVLASWTHVSDRAFRVLVRMALTALDEPTSAVPAGLYFAGRDLLAMTLRNERGGSKNTLYTTVKRALAELVKEGAIERTNAGRSGSNSAYRLRLDGARRAPAPPVEGDTSGPPKRPRAPDLGDTCGPPNPPPFAASEPIQGDTHGPPQGDTHGPPQGDTSSPIRGTPADPPRNQEEPREELLEEITLDLAADVTGSRVRDADDNPIRLPASKDGGGPDGYAAGPITTTAAADLKAADLPLPRCVHGWHDVIRTDGRHCCPACRRKLPARPPEPATPAATGRPATLAHQPPSAPRQTPARAAPGAAVLPFRRRTHRPQRREPA